MKSTRSTKEPSYMDKIKRALKREYEFSNDFSDAERKEVVDALSLLTTRIDEDSLVGVLRAIYKTNLP